MPTKGSANRVQRKAFSDYAEAQPAFCQGFQGRKTALSDVKNANDSKSRVWKQSLLTAKLSSIITQKKQIPLAEQNPKNLPGKYIFSGFQEIANSL